MVHDLGKAALFRAVSCARRSANRFKTGRLIPKEILRDVLESSLRAPSSFNLQPSQVVLVENQGLKVELADKAMLGVGNQYRTRDCSALAVFLADLEAGKRIQRVYQLEKDWGRRHPNYMAMMPLSSSYLVGEGHAATLAKNVTADILSATIKQPMPQIESAQAWSYKNTALLVQSYLLAATSHDLATTPMEGFDPRWVLEILRIPDRYAIPVIVATGYDYEEQPKEEADFTPRLDLDEVVFRDTFGVPFTTPTSDDDEQQSSGEASG